MPRVPRRRIEVREITAARLDRLAAQHKRAVCDLVEALSLRAEAHPADVAHDLATVEQLQPLQGTGRRALAAARRAAREKSEID